GSGTASSTATLRIVRLRAGEVPPCLCREVLRMSSICVTRIEYKRANLTEVVRDNPVRAVGKFLMCAQRAAAALHLSTSARGVVYCTKFGPEPDCTATEQPRSAGLALYRTVKV